MCGRDTCQTMPGMATSQPSSKQHACTELLSAAALTLAPAAHAFPRLTVLSCGPGCMCCFLVTAHLSALSCAQRVSPCVCFADVPESTQQPAVLTHPGRQAHSIPGRQWLHRLRPVCCRWCPALAGSGLSSGIASALGLLQAQLCLSPVSLLTLSATVSMTAMRLWREEHDPDCDTNACTC